jgi:hypothetical protein
MEDIDCRDRHSKEPFFFLNSKEGFERFLQRIEYIRVMNGTNGPY